jgi:Calcineurin-like phosphoesterase
MPHRPPGASGPGKNASGPGKDASGSRHDVIRVLAVSDEVDHAKQADLGTLRGAELILACGDLPSDYLSFLMDALNLPLVFVPGNHDADMSGYRVSRAGLTLRAGLPVRPPWPEGGVNADGRVVDVAGLRVAGLGGCLRYGSGPHQYTERQQSRRCRALRRRAARRRLRDGRGIDVLITHAPPRGIGDSDDAAHRGFSCYHGLVAALEPAALLHGHVYPHGAPAGGGRLGRTMVRNVVGLHLIDIAAGPAGPAAPARAVGIRHAL